VNWLQRIQTPQSLTGDRRFSTMQEFKFTAASEQDTDRLGRCLAAQLPETATVALEGTLGAGKTRLVQAIAVGCGIDAHSVTSPTFVLCQPYCGTRHLYHLDAYRVNDLDEFLELGVDEYFEGPGLTLIEWSDRVAPCLPPEYLKIQIDITGQNGRQFSLTAYGDAMEKALQDIVTALSAESSD